MNKIIEWIKDEPVRVRIYSLIGAVIVYLLARGVIQPTDVEFILTVAALILGVERSRAQVSPVKRRA